MVTRATDYNWSRYTPLDNTGSDYSVFKSAFKNIRFAIPLSKKYMITASDEANLFGLSFKFYGDISLWRVLLEYNGLVDPLNDLYVGRVINIPNKSDVIAYIAKQQNNTTATFTI